LIESTQVRIGLIDPSREIFNSETGVTVSGKDVIKQIKTNNRWTNDKDGRYVMVQYDSLTFNFREGETLTVPESVARCLRHSSVITVGSDKLNGPMIPFLEVKEKLEMALPTAEKKTTPTTCPICGEDQKTFPALTRHLGQERKKHPELFEEEKSKTDWEGKSGTTTDEVED
jgi:hypothetical protein